MQQEIAWSARGAARRHARREDSEHKKLAAHTAALAGKAGGRQSRARNLVVPVDLRVAWFRDALVVAVELALALEVRAHIALTVELLQPHLLFRRLPALRVPRALASLGRCRYSGNNAEYECHAHALEGAPPASSAVARSVLAHHLLHRSQGVRCV